MERGYREVKPLIGITAANFQDKTCFMTKASYVNAILLSGGTPILIPYSSDIEECKNIIDKLDGLLIPGGIDVSPLNYGEEPIPQVNFSINNMDLFEIELIKEAKKLDKPILAICRGIQVLNVAFGGTLYQDIHAQNVALLCHRQDMSIRSEMTHSVKLSPDSTIFNIYKQEKIYVNSFHHQAVKVLADTLVPAAYSKDDILEACESEDGRIIGVQWHPEGLIDSDSNTKKLFSYFVDLCCI